MNIYISAAGHEEFVGACINNGAQKNVIRKQQDAANYKGKFTESAIKEVNASVKNKFRYAPYEGLGRIVVRDTIKD